MNIIIKDGTIKRTISTLIRKFSDSNKKDMISETRLFTDIIFKDKDGTIYPDGKIIRSDEYVTMHNYEYTKDEDSNITSCKVTTSKMKNGKSIDIEKTTSTKYYDKQGRLIEEDFFTRDGIMYLRQRYEYDTDGNVIARKDKSTDTKQTIKYHHNGEVISIVNETIKSKAIHKKYNAFFDNKNRVYKTIDGDKSIETDYEREFDGDGNILSETKRFFDISTTNKKLISYITTTYNPASGYKIDSVIKNGILTEKHEYNLKGEELGMFMVEEGKELFKRVETSNDSDTGNKTTITSIKIIDQESGKVIKDSSIKTIHDKDNKLLSYSEDNTIVSTYEYDEEGRRSSVITKKLIDDEFVVINEVLYTYSTDEETGKTIKTRQLTVFDKDGNITNKDVHTEIFDETSDTYEFDKTLFEVTKDDTTTEE